MTDAAAGRMSGRGAESGPAEFSQEDLRRLCRRAERVEKDAEWYGARLVVEVYDRGDARPVHGI